MRPRLDTAFSLLVFFLAGACPACGPVGTRTVRVEAGAEEDSGSEDPPTFDSGGGRTGGMSGAAGNDGTGGSSGGSGGTGGGTGGMDAAVSMPDAGPDSGGGGGMDTAPPPRDTAPDLAPDSALSPTLAMGLVSRWKLDEGTGNTARDAVTATGNDGMLSGGSSWTQMGFPMAKHPNMGALTFSGGVLDVGVKGMPSLTQATSIALWVSYASVPGSTQPFIGFGTAGTGRLKLGFTNNQIAAWKASGGSTVLVGVAPPSSGWHHVVYTFDGTTRRLYLDGTERDTSTMAGDTGAVTTGHIGSYGTQTFSGTVDEVRIYDRALSATEVTALAAGNE